MSLGARATKRGAKVGKETKTHDTKAKTDKPVKEKVKPQATTEQLRMACMIDRKSEDASDVRKKVLELMEMTCRTEEEVCSALHDSDNDLVLACNLLLEDTSHLQGEWQTREKKKKKPTPAAGNGEADPPPRDPRSRSGPRPRRGEGEGGGRGRGSLRGRGAGRGGRGARRPPRARNEHCHDLGGTNADSFPTTEDWDNEEWSGSLSDTKVFTASSNLQNATSEDPGAVPATEDWDTPETNGPTDQPHIPSYTCHNKRTPLSTPVAVEAAPPADTFRPNNIHQPMGMSGSLSAAQTQYLSQLTQQVQRRDTSIYSNNYMYSELGARKPARAKVPPPSKIPSSAVEMPAAPDTSGAVFLDVQFGAIDTETLQEAAPTTQIQGMGPSSPERAETSSSPPHTYTNTLSESVTTVDSTPSQQTVSSEPPPASNTSSLEKQLSARMKQLSVSATTPPAMTQPHTPAKPLTQQPAATPPAPAPTTTQNTLASQNSQQNVYHHAATHHPPVYPPSVYAAHQVNSTNASLTGAAAHAYPSSVTLTHYQPIINSYQQLQQTSSSGAAYGGAALYTAAPYTAPYHQPAHHKLHKDAQYDSSVASSNSLTSTNTTQTSTAKVAATTASASSTNNSGVVSSAAYGGALYGAGTQYSYDEHALHPRATLPHHVLTGGYYEVGYGARDGTFALGATDRFARTDAASPQQVPAALPPGYAYFYQPPPTTYQYGVYPTYGGGSSVGGVSGVGGVSAPSGKVNTYQQPPYDAQDTYKTGGGYTGSGNKSAGAGAELANPAVYAKTHVALNKLNSYEKATFHSGTPPPFGASTHLYIPAPPPLHHAHHHAPPPPQPLQMDVRVNSSHNRRESGAGGRSASNKTAPGKPQYSQSYWPPN